ncbi:UNKNOWN [Stylonychia lemnae]|uniref:Uncharacterized protein n=1 Tax=Stylonychia lemnae TaxID=5949 RepID=A0A078B1Q9_STYLE|nr:UNKNOWN [Stylonychia lemnae]|eukprot:CDW88439.1 UNKNOWN [Stylonychia lemnae]
MYEYMKEIDLSHHKIQSQFNLFEELGGDFSILIYNEIEQSKYILFESKSYIERKNIYLVWDIQSNKLVKELKFYNKIKNREFKRINGSNYFYFLEDSGVYFQNINKILSDDYDYEQNLTLVKIQEGYQDFKILGDDLLFIQFKNDFYFFIKIDVNKINFAELSSNLQNISEWTQCSSGIQTVGQDLKIKYIEQFQIYLLHLELADRNAYGKLNSLVILNSKSNHTLIIMWDSSRKKYLIIDKYDFSFKEEIDQEELRFVRDLDLLYAIDQNNYLKSIDPCTGKISKENKLNIEQGFKIYQASLLATYLILQLQDEDQTPCLQKLLMKYGYFQMT